MLEDYYVKPATVDRVRASWLAPQIESYLEWLESHRYSRLVVYRRLPLLFHFAEFAQKKGCKDVASCKAYIKEFVSQWLEQHGAKSKTAVVKKPTAEEWAAFAASCNLRDMGTHLCALPTGEHCPKGLICLGCAHPQPKKSAVSIFRRMLTSHERSLATARGHSEPAGQIAAREMEIVRIKGALQRAEELSDDVAAAIERAS